MRKISSLIAAAAFTVTGGLTVVSVPGADAASGPSHVRHQRLCNAHAARGNATCFAEKLVDDHGVAVNAAGGKVTARAVSGLTPSNVQDAYKTTGVKSKGRTVAIVDAYGYPNAERDLGVYRKQFGLSACTKANGCLTIMSQTGSTTSLPKTDVGWAGEQALDLDAVSATCPDCKILLVQANSASMDDIGEAVNTAAKQAGVVAISNSYGTGDVDDESLGAAYDHPGIALTASSGDDGYEGPSFPASSHYVTAVGGTTLKTASNTRGWTESVWKGSGSGCTTKNEAPEGQDSDITKCTGRAMADVAAVADPSTGLAVYAPTTASSSSWAVYGGTSLSAPVVAAVYALSGDTDGYANTIPYAHESELFDVTSGDNGDCDNWCTAKEGWDGPTGLGTPNGVGAF